MEIVGPVTWREYIEFIRVELDLFTKTKKEAGPLEYFSSTLFRGQADELWDLDTSLERFLRSEGLSGEGLFDAYSYYEILDSIIPSINSYVDKTFDRIILSDLEIHGRMQSLPHYELMCYARHHGFPSPLLDWTQSFYIAAYFAYSNAKAERNSAVYMLREWNGEARGGWVGDPLIVGMGHYVTAPKRHFAQQSEYTYCGKWVDEKLVFCSHEDADRLTSSEQVMKKIILDHRSRGEALNELSMMNINDFTLYGDENSLMRALAFEKIVRRGVGR
ncbi:FRG domain-containing protein [Oryzibacter oryziterrae]|uniref:FRG domain-containing protein n=1 Tax=Oryzibacter oryziterrae TaxID=2766474 RepID=UPI001F273102|nr:FRG domain-containing protein [Oryzibacter oryziterrae]